LAADGFPVTHSSVSSASAASRSNELTTLKARTRRDGHALVFGRTADEPFTPSHVRKTAEKAWAAENDRRTEEAAKNDTKPVLLTPIGLHEARHSYASMAIAAGFNAKSLQTFMGHSSIETTYNLYGHLLAGAEEEAASLFDSYLSRADTSARLAQIDSAES